MTSSFAALEELEAIFPSRRAFLQSAVVQATECRLYWAAPEASFTLHAPLRVILGFEGDETRFTFRGQVFKVVEEARLTHRMGAVIRIVGDEQRSFGAAVSYARGADPALGRRAHPRRASHVSARLGDGLAAQAVLLDLSAGGAFAELSGNCPPVGSLQPLAVDAGQGRFVIPVRVCWAGPRHGRSGCGLEFLELEPSARAWLDKLLSA